MRINPRVSVPLSALVGALLVACAPAPGPSTANAPRDRDVITANELADVRVADGSVLEAIRRLRPRFLNEGVGSSMPPATPPGSKAVLNPVMASVNGASPVALSELGRMSVSEVAEVRYLSIADAGFRFGLSGNNSPVLLITLKPR